MRAHVRHPLLCYNERAASHVPETFELPEEECSLDEGVIRLALRFSPPRRMRLKRDSEGAAPLCHLS